MIILKGCIALLLLWAVSTDLAAAKPPSVPEDPELLYAEIEPWHCSSRIDPDGFSNHFNLPTPPEGKVLILKSIAFKNTATNGWFPLWSVNIFSGGFWLWGWSTPNAPTTTLYVGSQGMNVNIPPYTATVNADGLYACDQVPLMSVFYELVATESVLEP